MIARIIIRFFFLRVKFSSEIVIAMAFSKFKFQMSRSLNIGHGLSKIVITISFQLISDKLLNHYLYFGEKLFHLIYK